MKFIPDSGSPRHEIRHGSLLLLLSAIIVLPNLSPSQPVSSNRRLDSLVNNVVQVCLTRLANSVGEVRDTTMYPTYGTRQLKWQLRKSDDWTTGFYPGCLWYAYELSNDPKFERWARQWTSSLEREKLNTGTHDLGFKFMCSYGNGLRLGKGRTDDTYREILLAAASTLAKRYDPKVGCLSSNWDRDPVGDSYPVIIDIMMNLELLFWASHNGGPSWYADLANSHAVTTCSDFVRSDGGTYHIVRYDTSACAIINKGTLQGAGDETTWSRGQAWAQYGMIVTYRHTREKRFLSMAVRLTDYFLNHLDDDNVSNWDFQSKIKSHDVSATCIVTSGLLELADYVENDSLKRHYQKAAESMLTSLCSPPYFTVGVNTSCLLDHSVQYLPLNSNVDVPSIFADYYFLEALQRYRTRHKDPIR